MYLILSVGGMGRNFIQIYYQVKRGWASFLFPNGSQASSRLFKLLLKCRPAGSGELLSEGCVGHSCVSPVSILILSLI